MGERPTKRRIPAPGSASRSGAAAGRGDTPARGDKVSSPAKRVSGAGKATGKATGRSPTRTTTPSSSTRYTPPDRDPRHRPSPIYVPIAMFTLLGAGMLLIVANYINVFGDASNVRLIIGLGLILGGILVATQYR